MNPFFDEAPSFDFFNAPESNMELAPDIPIPLPPPPVRRKTINLNNTNFPDRETHLKKIREQIQKNKALSYFCVDKIKEKTDKDFSYFLIDKE